MLIISLEYLLKGTNTKFEVDYNHKSELVIFLPLTVWSILIIITDIGNI